MTLLATHVDPKASDIRIPTFPASHHLLSPPGQDIDEPDVQDADVEVIDLLLPFVNARFIRKRSYKGKVG